MEGYTLEKKSIINEIFEETYERLDDSVEMKIETLRHKDKISINCSKCNALLNKVYSRYDDSDIEYGDDAFDLKVFKCPECKNVYAYWIDNFFRNRGFDFDDVNSEPTGNQPLDNKRNPAIPKKCAKEYAKATEAQTPKNKGLNRLVETKINELYKIGLSLTTINLARSEVYRYILPNTTLKKINIMFAAAIYVKANGITTDRGLWKHQGEGVTERQLEEIFGISRKTIRKWVEKFY